MTVTEQMQNLDRLRAESMALHNKLKGSLSLQQFYPDAFKHGSCRVYGYGNLMYRPSEAKFVIKLGNDEKVEFPLMSVPMHLWTRQMCEEYVKGGGRVNRRKQLQKAGVEI